HLDVGARQPVDERREAPGAPRGAAGRVLGRASRRARRVHGGDARGRRADHRARSPRVPGLRGHRGRRRRRHLGPGVIMTTPTLTGPNQSMSRATDARVSVRDLRVRYSEAEPLVLDGVDLDLHAGETVALLGSSGSGKSTRMTAVTGLA